MSGKYLLDTSIIIEIFAQNAGVIDRLGQAESTFIPSVAVGELHYGVRRSTREKENLAQVEQLVAAGVVLACDEETGRWYGIVKDQLRRTGHPIPENDIWIAALALQHGLSVATRDNHFKTVKGLKVEIW